MPNYYRDFELYQKGEQRVAENYGCNCRIYGASPVDLREKINARYKKL